MKKIILAFLIITLSTGSAQAKPWRPYHHHKKDCCISRNLAAGVLGITAGVLIANSITPPQKRKRYSKPVVHIVEPENNCYTVVSRKSGKIRQECFENSSDKIIYVD